MCYWYIEQKFCSRGAHCLGGYGWVNASNDLYVQPYATLHRTRLCEQSSKIGGCAGESHLGPGSDIKTSEQMCKFCSRGGDVPKTERAGKKRKEGGRGGDGGKGSGGGDKNPGPKVEVDDDVEDVVGRGWQRSGKDTEGKGKGKRGVSSDRKSEGSSEGEGSEKKRVRGG